MGHHARAATIGTMTSILAWSEPHPSTSNYNPISDWAPTGRINGCQNLNKAARLDHLTEHWDNNPNSGHLVIRFITSYSVMCKILWDTFIFLQNWKHVKLISICLHWIENAFTATPGGFRAPIVTTPDPSGCCFYLVDNYTAFASIRFWNQKFWYLPESRSTYLLHVFSYLFVWCRTFYIEHVYHTLGVFRDHVYFCYSCKNHWIY